eukprot:1161596-Pelagomonas_calceolata.AAC.5
MEWKKKWLFRFRISVFYLGENPAQGDVSGVYGGRKHKMLGVKKGLVRFEKENWERASPAKWERYPALMDHAGHARSTSEKSFQTASALKEAIPPRKAAVSFFTKLLYMKKASCKLEAYLLGIVAEGLSCTESSFQAVLTLFKL